MLLPLVWQVWMGSLPVINKAAGLNKGSQIICYFNRHTRI